MQRRCYWLLDGDEAIVLVHYLDVQHASSRARQVRHSALAEGTG